MTRKEMWSALYMYNRHILSYMVGQEALTKTERLLLKILEEFLGLAETAMDVPEQSAKLRLTVLPGGKG